MVYKCFDKQSRDITTHTGTRIISNDQQLANELHRPITRKLRNTKYIHHFEITFGVLIINKQIGKNKKGVTIVNVFQKKI